MDHFNFFLSHGLWSVVESLFNASERIIKEEDKNLMEKLMLEIATHPNQSRINSPTIGKPWQLSWLASAFIYKVTSLTSLELRSLKWFSEHKLSRADIDKLKKVSEMHGILCNLPELISYELKNEIIQLYIAIISMDRSKTQTPSNPRGISLNAVEYLRKCLIQNPVNTNLVIQRLLCLWSSHFTHSDGMLLDVYDKAFSDLLNNSESEEVTSKIITLLTIFEVSEEKEKKIVEIVFPKLLELCYSGKINLAQVYLSLIGRGKFGLLKVLIGLETGKQLWKCSGCEDATANEAILRNLVNDGKINMREVFLRSHKRNVPWIEDIVELCVNAVMAHNIDSVKACLSHSGLKKLWPLICYGVWENFLMHGKSSEEDLYSLIEECKNATDDKEYLHQMFQLEQCLRFSNWIVRSGSARRDSVASVIEKVINSCCTVHVLKQTVRLEDLDENSVVEAVQNFRKSHSSHPSHSLIVQTEISTCRGYYIVMSVYKAILASVEAEHLGDANGQTSQGESRTKYEETVKDKLTYVKNSLGQLHPLSFRVEILEYVFSLLFLRHKDIHEENTSDSGGGEEESDTQGCQEVFTTTSDATGADPLGPSMGVGLLPSTKQSGSPEAKDSFSKAYAYLAPGLYICGPKVVRDLLQCLKDCLVDASVALFGLLATVDPGSDVGEMGSSSSPHATSEVVSTHEMLQKRLARLSHSVGEVACRLEIVSTEGARSSMQVSPWYPIWRDLPGASKILPIRVSQAWSEDDSGDERGPSGVRRVPASSQARGELRRKKSRSENEKSSESGSNAGGGGAWSEGGRRRRRRRVTWKRASSSSGEGASRSSLHRASLQSGRTLGIMERMMASPRSLVICCLSQGEIAKAHRVIKLFKLEGSTLALEARFLEEYISLLHKLDKKTKEGNLSMASSSSASWKSPLQSVKNAALAGMNSTSFSSLVEAFLTTVRPPVVEGLDAVAYEDQVPLCLSEMLHLDERHSLQGYAYSAVVAIDLTFTYPGTAEQSSSLMDVAIKHCPKGGRQGLGKEMEGSGVPHGSPKGHTSSAAQMASMTTGPIGPSTFLQNVHSTLKVVNGRHGQGNGGAELWSLVDNQLFGSQNKQLSVPELLATCLPLNSDSLAASLSFWEELYKSVVEFRRASVRNEGSSDMDSIGTASSDSEARRKVTLKELHSSMVNGAFNKIITVSRTLPWHLEGIMHHEHGRRPSGSRDNQYLQMIFSYLKMISSLMVQSSLQAKGYAAPTNYFDILTEDIGSIIGKLTFECDVPPSRLESVASKMNLDLVCCFMHNCCPPIKCMLPPLECMELYKTRKVKLGKWGHVILNPVPKGWQGPSRPPGPLAEALLTTLLHELRACDVQCHGFLAHSDLVAASRDPKVVALLEEGPRELAEADLSLLCPGEDTLAFLANLANLLTLHAILTLEVGIHGKPFGLLSQSHLECLVARMSVCYRVSSLGFVSIHDLTKTILGESLALAICDPSPWSNVRLDYSKSVMRAWPFPLHCTLWPPTLPTPVPHPGFLFALTVGRAWDAKATALPAKPTTLDTHLSALASDFLSTNVKFSSDSCRPNSLTVPRLACLYHSALEDDSQSIQSEGSAAPLDNCASLVKCLAEHLSGQLKDDLNQLLVRLTTAQDVVLKVTGSRSAPRITLDCVQVIGEWDVEGEPLPSNQPSWSWKGGPPPSAILEYLELRCWPLAIVAAIANAPGVSVVLPPLMPHATSFKHLLQEVLEYPEMINHGIKMVAALSPEGLPSSQLWDVVGSLFLLPVDKLPSEQLLAILRMIPQPRLHREPKVVALHDMIKWEISSREPSKGVEEPWRYGIQIRDPVVRVACVLQNITMWASSKEGACREALLSLCSNKAVDVPPPAKALVVDTLRKIEVYEKILAHVKSAEVKNWHDVSQLLETDPGVILQKLIQANQMPLFLKWMALRDPQVDGDDLVMDLIGPNVLVGLLLDADPPEFDHAKKLLGLLPLVRAAQVCQGSLPLLPSAPCLRFVLSFLLDSCRDILSEDEVCHYEQWALGLLMVSHRLLLGNRRRVGRSGGGYHSSSWSWLDLAPHPLLIVEQLLMNVQMEALEGALALVRPHLKANDNTKCRGITLGDVDSLLRQYATKALDFRVCSSIAPVPKDEGAHPFVPPPSTKMSLSTSTLSLARVNADSLSSSGSVHSLELMPPPKVPTKAEWVPNDEVTVCMCCQMVSFSMFNRRHHCRRCGRVICALCSAHRLKVEGYLGVPVRVCDDCHSGIHRRKVAGYGDVPVRVCDSCHKGQMSSLGECGEEEEEEGEEVAEEEDGGMGGGRGGAWWWRLSGDAGQDATLREEFAFEQAPSASLCLAILAHHSPGGPHHPRLLIESAERLLSHLRPSNNASSPTTLNPEVDHALLIQMVRSLAVASKVLYSRLGMTTGIERCDRVIGRAGLVNLLVRSGWAGAGEWAGALLAPPDSGGPPSAGPEAGNVVRSGSVGRRPPNSRGLPGLRDRLVKEEQWELALEVATKGGLGRAAIWAAWGKACLKVGGWKRARSLFARCLQPSPSLGTSAATSSLLVEILQILEESSMVLPVPLEDPPSRTLQQPYPLVLESLSCLDALSKGIILLPSLRTSRTGGDPVWSSPPLSEEVREECLYYLRTYGSDAMVLDFHLRHGEMKEALLHFLNMRMNPEVFLDDVYLRCFRKGWVMQLEAEMKAVDPSLEHWKPHLCCMCRTLERRGMLQVLYKLQVFAGDNVRAAMTCIRFYCRDAASFSQMKQNCVHLRNAQRHMEDELAKDGWVEGAISSSVGMRASPD
ncbi:uncharacterized protein [Hetaerina americana]|uniref:uncharacterized protein n=1 Tax=Hetaerina americana TaxID=62018 RepID=UPI003A7F1FDD